MPLSINEAKFPGLRARNCATIQQVLIKKFHAFGLAKLPGLSRNGRGPGLRINRDWLKFSWWMTHNYTRMDWLTCLVIELPGFASNLSMLQQIPFLILG